MGYDIEEIYRMEWSDRPDAVVRARSIGSGEMLAWSADHADAQSREAHFNRAIELLADVVVDWTLERRGRPLPIHDLSEVDDGDERKTLRETNMASLRLIGHRFLLEIFSSYMGEAVQVQEESDLGKDSRSGGSFPAELQTMEVL